jgi:hypothetical protein
MAVKNPAAPPPIIIMSYFEFNEFFCKYRLIFKIKSPAGLERDFSLFLDYYLVRI